MAKRRKRYRERVVGGKRFSFSLSLTKEQIDLFNLISKREFGSKTVLLGYTIGHIIKYYKKYGSLHNIFSSSL